MKILIINLDAQKQRMAFQKAQMKNFGLEFIRLRATQIDDLDAGDIQQMSGQWERPLRPSEIACLASHRAAWEMVVSADSPMLILEDDVLLSMHVPEILAGLENKIDFDHVTFEARSRKKILGNGPQDLSKNAKLSRLYQDRTGAAAYVLWPRGAQILLENSGRAAGLADGIIAAAYQMSSWQIEPAAAIQLDQCEAYGFNSPIKTQSTIGTNGHDKPKASSLVSAMKFKIRRIGAQLRMGLRQLSTLGRAKRRFVAVEIDEFQSHIPIKSR